jgi:hypothetical protein
VSAYCHAHISPYLSMIHLLVFREDGRTLPAVIPITPVTMERILVGMVMYFWRMGGRSLQMRVPPVYAVYMQASQARRICSTCCATGYGHTTDSLYSSDHARHSINSRSWVVM